ncbi:hypothetical protein [Solirhodobacter olei]|uniref:hypothetical protein n=1 Tax=Solirhodobacter olei TaxID=2493082 RepID=UPI000FD6D020|nr:hypothetical protein [Solirhodobacter olei]
MTQFCKLRDRFFIDGGPLQRYNGQPFRILGLDVESDAGGQPDWHFQVRFADGSVHDHINAEFLFSDLDAELDSLTAVL